MREIRLHTPQSLRVQDAVELDEMAANHLARVLRARLGDPVTLFNGDGFNYHGRVTDIAKRRVIVTLESQSNPENESPLASHLGLCLSKGERFDWAIQKATELGVTEITPLFSERVDVKLPSDRLARKLGHWQQVVVSACEQCARATVPTVHTPTGLHEWVSQVSADAKLVLHHHQPAPLQAQNPRSVALLVGPEGGLSEPEVSLAEAAGFDRLRLGPRVLRTETAPAVALSVMGALWGDLQA